MKHCLVCSSVDVAAIERARMELSIRDPRPGGAGRAYAHAPARAVLRQLGDGA